MDLRKEIEQLAAVGFSQKETVEMLITKGFTKEEIANTIYEYYDRPEKKWVPFALSVVGQVVIMVFCGFGIFFSENYIVIVPAVVCILLTGGFLQGNRNCTIAWMAIFLIAVVFFLFASFSLSSHLFSGVLLSSLFARSTWTVLDDRKLQEEQYRFD